MQKKINLVLILNLVHIFSLNGQLKSNMGVISNDQEKSILANACNLVVNAGPDITICAGIGKTINANASSTRTITYEWEPPDGLDDPTKLKPVANPAATTTYTLTARATSAELIVNGDMEAGGIGPAISSYGYVSGLAIVTNFSSNYTVLSYPQIAGQFGCETRGANSMVIHGSTGVGQNFWCQTIPVSQNRAYKYEFWVMSVFNFFFTPLITLKINNVQINSIAASGTCSWDDVTGVWNSGGATMATICLSNATVGGLGNGCAIDDISFKECCEEKDEVTVTVYDINADIADPEIIGCNNRPVTLDGSGSSSGTGVSYEWTTADGKILGPTNTNKIKADAPGKYKLTVKGLYGCEKEVEVVVMGNVKPPIIQAKNTSINCITNNGIIEAVAATGQTYEWEGPSDFMSQKMKDKVIEAGVYTVTVTDAYGCTATASTTVLDKRSIIDLRLKGDTITCVKDSALLIAQSANTNINYTWITPKKININNQKIYARDTGWFLCIATDSLNCMIIDSFFVYDYKKNLPIKLSADTINCKNTNATISINADTSGSVLWKGPNGFSSTNKNVQVSESGWYKLDITTKDGCTGVDSIFVSKNINIPDISVSTEDTITCSKKNVSLIGNTNTINSTYEWRLNNFTIGNTKELTVQDSGTYQLIITSSNGCSSEKSVRIYKKVDVPFLQVKNDTINCLRKNIRLTFNSPDAVLTTWSGPNGFTSMDSFPTITQPGDYNLIIQDKNGCSNASKLNIAIDTTSPNAIITTDTLTCNRLFTIPNIVVNSQVIDFSWIVNGNVFSKLKNPSLIQTGNIKVEITSANGCKSIIDHFIYENKTKPIATLSADTIKCNSAAYINASLDPQTSRYQWLGPNGYQSNTKQSNVNESGWYLLIQTAYNGCIGIDSIFVIQKDVLPDIYAKEDTITCNKKSITLQAGSATNNVMYEWTGPNGFQSKIATPTVQDSGLYTLKVIDANGCIATKKIYIAKNGQAPEAFIVGLDSILNCNNPSLLLNYSTTPDKHTFVWKGPNNFSSNDKEINITQQGIYQLELTNEFGCKTIVTKIITEDKSKPIFTTANDSITCLRDTITLTLNHNESTTSYLWSSINNFTSTEKNPIITKGGNYKILLTKNNGCKDSSIITIIESIDKPLLSLMGDTINCKHATVDINATSDITTRKTTWSGPDGFQSSDPKITIDKGGLYACTVINILNGCETLEIIEIIEDSARIRNLGLELRDDHCSQSTGSICFCKIEGGTAPYSYSIDSGLTFQAINEFNKLKSGIYHLIVRDAKDCIYKISNIIQGTNGIQIATNNSLNIDVGASAVLSFNATRPAADIVSIQWIPSDQLSCSDCPNPTLTATKDQLIQLKVIDVDGCESVTTIQIKVNTKNDDIYLPNTFSANQDQLNDYFYPKSAKEKNVRTLKIYNRWGELIFENNNFKTNDEKAGWNGTFRGVAAITGVYLFLMEYESEGKIIQLTGDITLIR